MISFLSEYNFAYFMWFYPLIYKRIVFHATQKYLKMLNNNKKRNILKC